MQKVPFKLLADLSYLFEGCSWLMKRSGNQNQMEIVVFVIYF